jgi:hypothetical protein
MFYQILQKLVRQFFLSFGRAPRTAMEWQQLKSRARELVAEQGGIPSITSKTTIDDLIAGPHISGGPKGQRIWDFSKDIPTRDVQSRTADVIPFPKGITGSKKVKAMMKSGDVKLGEAPKTLPETLRRKKDVLEGQINKEMWQKQKMAENKAAIRRFEEKMKKDTVEDFRDKGDWDPSGFAYGGIAPLIGEPSYAADFYDDRIPMAGGGALKKFIEALFIKASNDIRQGKGKWKGLDQKQRIVQHDNLTKKVTDYQKTGKTEGLEEYFDVNPEEAFAAVETKVKKPYSFSLNREKLTTQFPTLTKQQVDEIMAMPVDQQKQKLTELMAAGTDERTMIQQKYPGITDDLVEKILIDDNPQRKAEVLATMDQFLKLKEVGKGSEEAFNIITKSIKDPTTHAEGGRAGYIFGGSAGLKGMWRTILEGISKGKDKPVKKFFPKLSAEEKSMEKVVMGSPAQKAFRAGEDELKLEGIDLLIRRLKHDKKILEQQAKNKAMKDEGLDFLMKHLEDTEMFPPHLKKYTDIDKDILQMENIKKNLIMKDRKVNAYGGRVSYSGGGKAGLPAITQGLPQGPQLGGMPQGPMQDTKQVTHLQQNPWMGSQMQQGIGGMPRPGGMQQGIGGMPRAQMAAGGMGRRAFMKLMAGLAALPFVGKGTTKVAPKALKAVEAVKVSTAPGMPTWFPRLVERVVKEGADVSKTHASKDMEIVHKAVLPDSKTDVMVTQSLDTGDVVVDIGLDKHGFPDGKFGQPARLVLRKGEWIEPQKAKTGQIQESGMKTTDEFYVDEAEFTGGHPENVKFEESVSEVYGDHVSDFSEVEKFATGTVSKKSKSVGTKEGFRDPDYASGGVARMLGE